MTTSVEAKPKSTRGRKPEGKMLPRQPLDPKQVPKDLKGKARDIYKRLAAELAVEGYAAASDQRTVILAAKMEAHVGKLEEAVDALPCLTTETKAGTKMHPLVCELRTSRVVLSNLYGALFLTPRARSTCRLTADAFRQAGQATDELGQFLSGVSNGENEG